MPNLTLRKSRTPVQTRPIPKLRTKTRGPWRAALLVILVFFLGGGYFAAQAPLSTSVIGVGRVAIEGQRRTVQSLEAGRIIEVLVEEGDIVAAGDPILRLDTSDIDLRISNTLSQLRQAAARQARLLAEQRGAENISATHWSLADRDNPLVMDTLRREERLFQDRRARTEAERVVLEQRIEQLRAQLGGEEIRLKSYEDRLRIVGEEMRDYESLANRGLATRARLTAFQREEADLRGEYGATVASIATVNASIGETQLLISEMRSRLLEEVSMQLPDVDTVRVDLEAELAELQQRRDRRSLFASIDGVIFNLIHSGPGPVIAAGEVVAEIVPFQEDVVIATSIRPADIDEITIGMPARLVFSAVPLDDARQTSAEVTFVSPDVVIDEAQQREYFLARVEVSRDQLALDMPDFEPLVGMPTEVYFVTGERTLLDYLAEPIRDVLRRGLRE